MDSKGDKGLGLTVINVVRLVQFAVFLYNLVTKRATGNLMLQLSVFINMQITFFKKIFNVLKSRNDTFPSSQQRILCFRLAL